MNLTVAVGKREATCAVMIGGRNIIPSSGRGPGCGRWHLHAKKLVVNAVGMLIHEKPRRGGTWPHKLAFLEEHPVGGVAINILFGGAPDEPIHRYTTNPHSSCAGELVRRAFLNTQ